MAVQESLIHTPRCPVRAVTFLQRLFNITCKPFLAVTPVSALLTTCQETSKVLQPEISRMKRNGK